MKLHFLNGDTLCVQSLLSCVRRVGGRASNHLLMYSIADQRYEDFASSNGWDLIVKIIVYIIAY